MHKKLSNLLQVMKKMVLLVLMEAQLMLNGFLLGKIDYNVFFHSLLKLFPGLEFIFVTIEHLVLHLPEEVLHWTVI